MPAHGGRPVPVAVDLGVHLGHVVAAAVALVLVIAVTLAIGNGSLAALAPAPAASGPAAGSEPVTGSEVTAVVVEPGDTLWSIARRVQPTGDIRPLVDQLVSLNGTQALQPGETVSVPA